MTLPTFTCLRCTHLWIPRIDGVPIICPKCKSPYWNRERRPSKKQGELKGGTEQ